MTVTGLNSDLYYSDNPILITIAGLSALVSYVEISLLSFVTISTAGINPLRIYTKGQTSVRLDISPIVKTIFPDIPHNTNYTSPTPFTVSNNWAKVSIYVKQTYLNGSSDSLPAIPKTFVKGGRRTYKSNQNTTVGTILTPTEIIPRWGGYPFDLWRFQNTISGLQLFKTNTTFLSLFPLNIELRKIKGCDPLYFKFKNSLGGYSYWLFENWNNEESNQNLGVLKGWDGLKDLGNEIDPAISVTSKIPKRFFPLIQDLIISEEIYIYTPGDGYSKQGVSIWEKITSNNNKLSQNLFNENEKVKLKFDRHYRYNPSVLW